MVEKLKRFGKWLRDSLILIAWATFGHSIISIVWWYAANYLAVYFKLPVVSLAMAGSVWLAVVMFIITFSFFMSYSRQLVEEHRLVKARDELVRLQEKLIAALDTVEK